MTTWGKNRETDAVMLRSQVEARQEHGGFSVVRPDSGEPKEGSGYPGR